MKYGVWRAKDFEIKPGKEIIDGREQWTCYHVYWKKTGERFPKGFNSHEIAMLWLKGFMRKANKIRKEAASRGIKTF